MRTLLLRAILLLTLVPAASVLAQFSYDDMPRMSIGELFDAGGKPTGDMNMRAMPWPIEELQKRERAAVSAEALRRLRNPAADEYTHAFGVNLLIDLGVPELDATLLDLYPNLDASGQYEVLLQGLDTANPAYAPLFVDVLRREALDPALTKLAVLSAAYASQVADILVHRALQDYWNSHASASYTDYTLTRLDGFPYSDVVNRSVGDVQGLFIEALQVGESILNRPVRDMTTAERNMLDEIRTRLLNPPSSQVSATHGTLGPMLEELPALFPGLQFVDVETDYLEMPLPGLPSAQSWTQSALFAWMCNALDIGFFRTSAKAEEWILTKDLFQGHRVANACHANAGFLLQLVAAPINKDTGEMTMLLFLQTPYYWINGGARLTFNVESVETVTDRLDIRPIKNSAGLILKLAGTAPEELGALTIRGQAVFSIPAELRITELDLRETDAIDMRDGAAVLAYRNSAEGISLEWGMKPSCCVRIGAQRTVSGSALYLYDTEGTLWEPGCCRSEIAGQGRWKFQKRDAEGPEPGKLVWIYAPAMERIAIPVTFEGVRIEALPQ